MNHAIPRTLFTPDHEAFRDAYRRFLDKEVVPHHAAWEAQGYVDREAWRKAGANGFLCSSMPEAYGGADADKLFQVVVMEENARLNLTGLGFTLHSEIVAPYLLRYGSESQKLQYLPAIDRGDHYLLNGSKTFITNGWHADLVIVVAKTNPTAGAKGTSLLLVERGMPGFEKGQPLHKVGLKAQDTCELFFADVKVPKTNLLGAENQGFVCLMQELPWERMQIAIGAVASARAAIDATLVYVKDRQVFGQALASYQNTRFKLAELHTETTIAQVFVDRCLELLMTDKLDTATASMAKAWCSELQGRVLDACVQLHGGYGFMWDTMVARAWADARVQRIYGGTTEIMWEVVARSMGLPPR